MIVDCGDCKLRNIACSDCVVTVLLGAPGRPVETDDSRVSGNAKISFDQEELGAMDALAEGGLVPRLRLVVGDESSVVGESLPRRDPSTDRHAM